MKVFNPIAFTPMAVTAVVAIVYLAILTPVIIIHETVPPPPDNPTLYRGLNLTQAWIDLKELSDGYHPYNSRRNDEVRDWLLLKIEGILDKNGVKYTGVGLGENVTSAEADNVLVETSIPTHDKPKAGHGGSRARDQSPPVTIFNDLVSNYTSTALTSIGVKGRRAGISTYFEGNNIMVYIRGTADVEGEWWKSDLHNKVDQSQGGVMVNAHFDSVSTGFGATDDGVGVITALQLIRYFSTSGNTPEKGLVVLLNNGEEDGLYGARAFVTHPLARFVRTFLNLEGAGAGGRATLFRSTDTEVTRAYSKAEHPFGSVISADGFAMGFVRSETDYIVFRAEGLRGLDVAFWEPRARYHTEQDDARHTSKASLWHMLSASVETTKYLTSDTSDQFTGERGDKDPSKVRNGKGSDSVWFDLFGKAFAVFPLRTLFALSLSLLVAVPLILFLVAGILVQQDKFYFFAGSVKPEGHENESIALGGWRGAFRFPIVLIIASGFTVGAAFLLRKINPFIIYSSSYAVWAMSLCLFFCIFWFLMAGCNFVRPSALVRGYSLIWLQALIFPILVVATVFEDRFQVSGGYLFVFYYAAVFLAALVSLLELFALDTKAFVVERLHDYHDTLEGLGAVPNSPSLLARNVTDPDNHEHERDRQRIRERELRDSEREARDRQRERERARESRGRVHDHREHEEANETTGLLAQVDNRGNTQLNITKGPLALANTFARRYRRHHSSDGSSDEEYHKKSKKPYGGEQPWSSNMPTFTWIIQFLLIAPFMLIILGQVGLLLVTATAQTGTDGSPLLLPYLIVALFSILLLLPIGPFMHRISYPLPTFLFLVFIGTLIYNLIAFPFSSNNRYKTYFQQTVDLDTGLNQVTLVGIEKYVREIVDYIPSAIGQSISCTVRPEIRAGLSFCSYDGIPPRVVKGVKDGIPPEKGYDNWLTYHATRIPGENKATFHISGKESKACILRFDDPFSAFHVDGAASNDGKWEDVPESGSDQIKLWHRDWNREWVVDVEWPVSEGKSPGEEGRSGRVVCLWSDQNSPDTIPALDEAQRFSPEWTSITKLMDGLVEGSKAFVV
jgi:hypothetical protein